MGSRDLLLKFRNPLYISGTVEGKTSNLAYRLATKSPKQKNAKLGQKGGRGVT